MKATIVSQENTMTTIRNIEIQVRQISKQLVEGQSSQFSVNTKTNPREHGNKIAFESDRIAEERDGNNVVAEKEKKMRLRGREMRKKKEKKRSKEENIMRKTKK